MTETMSRLSGRAAEKIWVKSYPASVPAEIAPHAHQSLGALFEASCAKFADRLAFSSMGRSMTFRELETSQKEHLDAEKAIRLMIARPSCIRSPVTRHPGGVLVGFHPAEWEAMLA